MKFKIWKFLVIRLDWVKVKLIYRLRTETAISRKIGITLSAFWNCFSIFWFDLGSFFVSPIQAPTRNKRRFDIYVYWTRLQFFVWSGEETCNNRLLLTPSVYFQCSIYDDRGNLQQYTNSFLPYYPLQACCWPLQ